MTMENRVWGQRRIQAELARLGFKVSARTIAKYMHPIDRRGPSSRWRSFLRQHASAIWACDFFCVQTITFRTLYVFFVIHHASRQVLHVHVTPHPTGDWAAQQIVECCSWDCKPPRFLLHDRDSCYGTPFDRRAHNLGIVHVRTPFRSPRANAIAERWVRSVRIERVCRLFQPLAPASFDRPTRALRAGDTCAPSERLRSKGHRNTCARRPPSRLVAGLGLEKTWID